MCSPDVVVLDVDAAPDGAGFSVLEALALNGFQGRVIVLSLRDGPALRARASHHARRRWSRSLQPPLTELRRERLSDDAGHLL